MGLAFNLETTPNPNLTEGLSKYFVNLPQEVQEGKINGGDIFNQNLLFRLKTSHALCQCVVGTRFKVEGLGFRV